MSLLNDLISYWKLDESSGSAVDTHGSNNLGVTGPVGTATGILNSARSFSVSYLSTSDNASLSTGDIDFSFSGWYYPTADPTVSNKAVFGKWTTTGNQREYCLFHLVSTKELMFNVSSNGSTAGSVPATTFGAIPLNSWTHFVCWHDSVNDEIGITLNGIEQKQSHSSGVLDSTAAFSVGSFNLQTFNAITGRIDELGFWKRVLTSQERSRLYNSGAGLAYDDFATTPGLDRRRRYAGGFGL